MVKLQFDPIVRRYKILKDDEVIDFGNMKDFDLKSDLPELLSRVGIDCEVEFVNLSESSW